MIMLNGFLPDDAVECFLDDDGDGDGDNLKERKLMKLCFLKSKNWMDETSGAVKYWKINENR